MLIVYWDAAGDLLKYYLSRVNLINGQYYGDIFTKLTKVVRK